MSKIAIAVSMIAVLFGPASVQGQELIIVPLSGGVLTLKPGIAEDLKEKIAEQVDRRARFRTEDDAPRATVIIKSSDPASTMRALVEYDLAPVDRLGPDVYIVQTGMDELQTLLDVPGLSAVDIMPSTAKIAADVNRTKPFEWQERQGGGVAYSVQVYPGTTAGEVEALKEFELVEALEDYNSNTIEILRVFTAVMNPDNLQVVAEMPFVARIEPAAPPAIPDNLNNTQPFSNVDDVQISPYNLSGAGIGVGIWEAAEQDTMGFGIRNTHESLTGRVTVEETSNASNHATHVAGTVASNGTTTGTEGMAPAASLASYGSGNDASEMIIARLSTGGSGDPLPIMISNHSYGIRIGWDNDGAALSGQNQGVFGQYQNQSAAFDNVVTGTDLIIVKSAGNHRNNTWDGIAPIPAPRPPRDCRQGGLGIDADCLSPRGVAKNVITVGAMTPAGTIAGFSSFGPTDDGRIKPDLMANGTQVTSTGANSNTHSYQNQGTSMATPAVAGIAALLLEEAGNQALALTAAGAKAILIQTARDVAGTGQATTGPDYATGWGVADAQAAIDLIRRPAGPGIAQESLAAAGAAGAYTQAFLMTAGEPELKVTLAWADPAGSTTMAQNQPRLVNDLDLRLIDPDGATIRPWTLNPASPGAAAMRNGGDDTINNVEQVAVLNPIAGIWQVQVTAKAASFTGMQDFALAGPFSPATGPFMSDPADIMLVLDRSGSMNNASATPGVSKLGAMQSAAEELANYVEIVGGHQLGIVQFSTSAGPTSPAFGLQALDSASIGSAEMSIRSLSGNGGTNIIDGIRQAAGQLTGPSAVNTTRQAIILFSDGRHNEPAGSDVATIDTEMADDTRFYSIGFGTDVDSTVMPGVAADHNGVHLEEQNLSAAQLSKLFLTVAGIAVDETIIVDPEYVVQPGGFASQSVVVGPDDGSITFATHWNATNPRQFSFSVQGPNERCVISEKGADGIQIRRGDRYHLFRIALPFKCPLTGNFMHEGEWRLGIRNRGSITDTAKVVVMSGSALQLKLDAKVNQRVLTLVAWLERRGKVVVDGPRLVGTLTMNWASTRDSGKQDQSGGATPGGGGVTLDRPVIRIDRLLLQPDIAAGIDPDLLSRLATRKSLMPENAFEPRQIIGLELRDDGREGDEKAFDGLYTSRLELDGEKLYQAHVKAYLPSRYGLITREALTSILVK